MSTRFILSIAFVFQCSTLRAAELIPFLRDQKLGATLREMKFPESFSKDLMSGLSTRILVRLELKADSRAPSLKMADITVKYDLWDENFKVNLAVGDEPPMSKTIASLKDVLSFLSELRIAGLWPVAEIPPSGVLNLKADALLNPIEKEQMEKIRKWVAQNSASAPLDPTGFGSAKPVFRSSALFNKIFEQYATGTSIASIWRETASAKPFQLAGVPHEKQ